MFSIPTMKVIHRRSKKLRILNNKNDDQLTSLANALKNPLSN